jgi:hypothetical protein
MMDLSHSVDDELQRNLVGLKNVDEIQCSIDAPPLRDQCIDGIVYCHNVIQHPPLVEKTAHALHALTAPGGEFVFNCYPLNDQGVVRWVRFHLVYKLLRMMLSRTPFAVIMFYARLMALLCLVPGLGVLLEKAGFCVLGDVPKLSAESAWGYLLRRFKNTSLNSFDNFGSHQFQHLRMTRFVRRSRPCSRTQLGVVNMDKYFLRPAPIGFALRVYR